MISSAPLVAMLAKLSSSSAGFNYHMQSKASQYRLAPWTLDFPADIYSKSSNNFFLGQLEPRLTIASGPTSRNKAWLYVPSSNNLNYEKPRDFSGTVQVALDFSLEWLAGANSQNTEVPSLLLEDVVSEVLQAWRVQNWGSGVVYNGAFSCQRGAVSEAAENGSGSFQQTVLFRMLFQRGV